MNSSTVSTIIMFGALIALMYFMMIRPQKKQQQKRLEMLSKLKKGDEVITLGRLHGVIDSINPTDHTIVLDCDGIYLTFETSAIMQVKNKKATSAATTGAVKKSTEQTTAAAKPTDKTEQK